MGITSSGEESSYGRVRVKPELRESTVTKLTILTVFALLIGIDAAGGYSAVQEPASFQTAGPCSGGSDCAVPEPASTQVACTPEPEPIQPV